jgi:hypothetical protein
MCTTNNVDGNANPNGIITSKSYPQAEANADCVTTFTTNNPNKVFRFYVTDINIDTADLSGK